MQGKSPGMLASFLSVNVSAFGCRTSAESTPQAQPPKLLSHSGDESHDDLPTRRIPAFKPRTRPVLPPSAHKPGGSSLASISSVPHFLMHPQFDVGQENHYMSCDLRSGLCLVTGATKTRAACCRSITLRAVMVVHGRRGCSGHYL